MKTVKKPAAKMAARKVKAVAGKRGAKSRFTEKHEKEQAPMFLKPKAKKAEPVVAKVEPAPTPKVEAPAIVKSDKPVEIYDAQNRVHPGLTLARQSGALLRKGERVPFGGADCHKKDRSVEILPEGEIVP